MNSTYMSIVMLVALIAIMYFLMIRPQKKKQKEVDQMRSKLSVGDEVVTIGGIKGKIVKTKDESIVIQVGADRVKFEMMRWSISSVIKAANAPKETEETEEEPKKVARPKKMVKKSAAAEEAPVEDAVPAEEAPAEQTESVETEEKTEE